jgi:hypothetical protein
VKTVTSAVKDRAILLGWIVGLVVVISLLWSLSFPFRSACLMRSTNKILALMDDPRQLAAPLLRPSAGGTVPGGPLGCWYTLSESGSLFFVFAIMKDGILIPCGAEIAENGRVTEIVPLGNHAGQAMPQIPQGLIQVYVRRIESVAAVMTEVR